ncbi:beta-L-arabinofuranosidase domain-containing protein [Bacillus infantis]|uniref:beta-L-arabinofuranosidase domain-containing protein n=1 Tax=Bacillus infantis TaxID=324767 RepID=UPI0020A038D8|nr:beta-L-arabinofuranosidase domain-containing protein [Bacillus infantis]MCP1160662.1 glycoside hydrolase family 127 protein [Bacillus infantis]
MDSIIQQQSKQMLNTAFRELPLGSIAPEGWLKKQLRIQADGFTGKLDQYWDDVGKESGWLGGRGESWERGPYYLDGLLPLAYLLNDESLKKKSQKWINAVIESQKEDGQFGPESNDDWWSRMVMLKVLMQYEEVTGDERVIPFMIKYFEYQSLHLKNRPLTAWAEARGGENILSLQWLYERTGESWLLNLANTIQAQTIDWTEIYSDFPFWRYQRRFDHRVHVVNVAMSLKYPALFYLQSHNEKDKVASLKGIESLMLYHGQAHGMFSGDEWLAGTHPSQGTELCSVVEYMYSLENLVRIFGEGIYADILEKVAFNALPATISADWHGHQYDQQVNQVLCTQAQRNWTLNGDESNMFGLEPNFGCCTANMHQGWPKYTARLWMKTLDHGLAAVSYSPCTIKTVVGNGAEVLVNVDTQYPFRDYVSIKLGLKEESTFPIKLRIPGWCENFSLKINGEDLAESKNVNGYVTVDRKWKNEDHIQLVLPMRIKFEKRADCAVSISRGPIVYALKIEELWRKRSGNNMFPNMEVVPLSSWNYGLKLNINYPEGSFKIEEKEIKNQPFSSSCPPVLLKGKGKKLSEWKLENNSAGTLPISPVHTNEPEEDVELIPYGGARLRIGEFPWVK